MVSEISQHILCVPRRVHLAVKELSIHASFWLTTLTRLVKHPSTVSFELFPHLSSTGSQNVFKHRLICDRVIFWFIGTVLHQAVHVNAHACCNLVAVSVLMAYMATTRDPSFRHPPVGGTKLHRRGALYR